MKASREMLLICGDADVLSSGFRSPLEENGVEFASVEHYCCHQTLTRLGLVTEAQALLQSDETAAALRAATRRQAMDTRPAHTEAQWLATYVDACRESAAERALRLRLAADAPFAEALHASADALLVVCDADDAHFGVGMDSADWDACIRAESLAPDDLLERFVGDAASGGLGKNRFGVMLMQLREEAAVARRRAHMRQRLFSVTALTASEQILALEGIFRPLSLWFAVPIVIKTRTYRSVEHYVYERLLASLQLGAKAIERLRTTADPAKVRQVAGDAIDDSVGALTDDQYYGHLAQIDRLYRRATRTKLSQHVLLQRLLLATGNALLVETRCSDEKVWSAGTDEREMQRLLCKTYISPAELLSWMVRARPLPRALAHLGRNKSGLYLMYLRSTMLSCGAADADPLPLSIAPADATMRSLLSTHLICFTAASVFHPFHLATIVADETSFATVAHFLFAKACEHFGLPTAVREEIVAAPTGNEAATIWAGEMSGRFPAADKLYAWEFGQVFGVLREAYNLLLDQHPALLRALLDTDDAVLVYCQRFQSSHLEWSVGMREQDLRAWLRLVAVDARTLLELCAAPLSRRPCFLGGNRLGVLLMEVRREFVLRGVFPESLPELSVSVEALLGSDSPTENMHLFDYFDAEDEGNYSAIWPNPLLLLAKRADCDALWRLATSAKQPPQVLDVQATDEQQRPAAAEAAAVARDSGGGGAGSLLFRPTVVDAATVASLNSDALRHLVMALVVKTKMLFDTSQRQRDELLQIGSEIQRMSELRHRWEEQQKLQESTPTNVDTPDIYELNLPNLDWPPHSDVADNLNDQLPSSPESAEAGEIVD